MWKLHGTYKGKPYENWSMDIEYLKSLLTKIIRNGGSGFIYREQKLHAGEGGI